MYNTPRSERISELEAQIKPLQEIIDKLTAEMSTVLSVSPEWDKIRRKREEYRYKLAVCRHKIDNLRDGFPENGHAPVINTDGVRLSQLTDGIE